MFESLKELAALKKQIDLFSSDLVRVKRKEEEFRSTVQLLRNRAEAKGRLLVLKKGARVC